MAAENPLVSVIMPVRNGLPFLQLALDSILGQTEKRFELLVVDDGSEDETPAVLARNAREDRRLRILASPGRGIVAALNVAIASAGAPYIARMDADDIALPARLATQLAYMEAHPEVAILGTAAHAIDEGGTRTEPVIMPSGGVALRAELGRRSPILHPTVMMRSEVVRRIGGYRQCCAYAEDYDLWLRASEVAEIENLQEILLLIRRHGAQTSRQRRLQQRATAALARALASERRKGLPERIEWDMDPARAVHTWLKTASPDLLADPQARKDFEVMMRSSAHSGLIGLRDLTGFRSAFAGMGIARSAATIAKIALGR